MGKGDMRTAKGKRFRGSFGKSRPKNKRKPGATPGKVLLPKPRTKK
jgi:30S ribosomal protein S31